LLAIPRGHRFAQLDVVPLKELRQEKYIDRINCEFRAAVIDYFMDHEALQRPRLQSDREDWVRAAVANGFGITITP